MTDQDPFRLPDSAASHTYCLCCVCPINGSNMVSAWDPGCPVHGREPRECAVYRRLT